MKQTDNCKNYPNLNINDLIDFTNATVEMKFGNLKNIKTVNKNRLNTNTIVSLMSTRETLKNMIVLAKPLINLIEN